MLIYVSRPSMADDGDVSCQVGSAVVVAVRTGAPTLAPTQRLEDRDSDHG